MKSLEIINEGLYAQECGAAASAYNTKVINPTALVATLPTS
jgi:hypothetical protein